MAAEFEKARVVGLDMCQVFPTSIIPPNCEFVQHNLVEGRLPFEDNTFDFVFQRLLLGGLRPKEWRHVVRELGRVTKPGGWIELVEIDGSGGNNGPKTMKVWNWIHQAFATQGIDVYIGRQQGLKKLLEEEACLPLVHHDTLQLDTGEHGGKIGELLKENEVAFWRAMTPLVLQRSQVTHEHFEQAIAEAEEEIEEYKSYHIFYCAYGQKPEKTLEEMDI
ncbi:hypothetical protein DFQ26_001277 [Actinomortierella ambigua]|nr:hypothetical protein DFQ26_001277 [Actinomortierella ambigua]